MGFKIPSMQSSAVKEFGLSCHHKQAITASSYLHEGNFFFFFFFFFNFLRSSLFSKPWASAHGSDLGISPGHAYMSYSLNSFKGVIYLSIVGLIKGDTGSLLEV